MRAPAILGLFGTALRAWWDDDAPRLGASLTVLNFLQQRSGIPD